MISVADERRRSDMLDSWRDTHEREYETGHAAHESITHATLATPVRIWLRATSSGATSRRKMPQYIQARRPRVVKMPQRNSPPAPCRRDALSEEPSPRGASLRVGWLDIWRFRWWRGQTYQDGAGRAASPRPPPQLPRASVYTPFLMPPRLYIYIIICDRWMRYLARLMQSRASIESE